MITEVERILLAIHENKMFWEGVKYGFVFGVAMGAFIISWVMVVFL